MWRMCVSKKSCGLGGSGDIREDFLGSVLSRRRKLNGMN